MSLEEIENTIGKLIYDVDNLEHEILSRIDSLEESINNLCSRVDDLENKLNAIESKLDDLIKGCLFLSATGSERGGIENEDRGSCKRTR